MTAFYCYLSFTDEAIIRLVKIMQPDDHFVRNNDRNSK